MFFYCFTINFYCAYGQEIADTIFGFDTVSGENKDAEFLLVGAGVGAQ